MFAQSSSSPLSMDDLEVNEDGEEHLEDALMGVVEEDASMVLPESCLAVVDEGGEKERCAVCLDVIQEVAFLDPCFHSFCFVCIYQWFQFNPSCPLCKEPIGSFIYDIRTTTEFKVMPILRPPTGPPRERVNRWGHSATDSPAGPSDLFPFTSAHERRKRVYQRDIAPIPLPGYRHRGSVSPQFMTELDWCRRAKPWVERELQCIAEEMDVSVLLLIFEQMFHNHQGDLRSTNLFQQLSEFLLHHTSTFMRELRCFMESGLNMVAYDRKVRYVALSLTENPISDGNPHQG